MSTLLSRACTWAFRYYGSTRSSALLRIALAVLAVYRFAGSGAHAMRSELTIAGWAFFVLVGTSMALGLFSRASSFVLGLLMLLLYYRYGVHLHDHEWTHHHTYLLGFSTLLLSLAPCGRSYSLDRLIRLRRAAAGGPPALPQEGNLFALRLLMVQLLALYFFAFWDKVFIANTNHIFYGFLDGSRLEQIILSIYWGSSFQIPPILDPVASAMSIAVCVIELALPLMVIERFQKWLSPFGIGMHIAFFVMLPLQTYSLTCISLYLAVYNANLIHGWIDLLGPGAGDGDGKTGQLAPA